MMTAHAVVEAGRAAPDASYPRSGFWPFVREAVGTAAVGTVLILVLAAIFVSPYEIIAAWFGMIYLVAVVIAALILGFVLRRRTTRSRTQSVLGIGAVGAAAVGLAVLWSVMFSIGSGGATADTVVVLHGVHFLFLFGAMMAVAIAWHIWQGVRTHRSGQARATPERDTMRP